MKKMLWLIVCLMTMVVSANAQSGWTRTQLSGDELLNTEACTAFIYSDTNGSVVLWDNNDKYFRIISANGTFNSKLDRNGRSLEYKSLFHAIIGYYDINNNLIDKRFCCFEVVNSHSQAHSIRYGMKRYEGKYIMSYLRNKKGYVRIVTALSGTNTKFDIKVPCMNN